MASSVFFRPIVHIYIYIYNIHDQDSPYLSIHRGATHMCVYIYICMYMCVCVCLRLCVCVSVCVGLHFAHDFIAHSEMFPHVPPGLSGYLPQRAAVRHGGRFSEAILRSLRLLLCCRHRLEGVSGFDEVSSLRPREEGEGESQP